MLRFWKIHRNIKTCTRSATNSGDQSCTSSSLGCRNGSCPKGSSWEALQRVLWRWPDSMTRGMEIWSLGASLTASVSWRWFSSWFLMLFFRVFSLVRNRWNSLINHDQSWLLMLCNDFDVSQKARLQSTPRKKQGNTIIYIMGKGSIWRKLFYVLLFFSDQADHKAWSIATSHRSRKLDCWVGGWTSPPWTSSAPRRAGWFSMARLLEGSGGYIIVYIFHFFLILICWVMFERGVILLALQDQYFGPEDSVAKIVTEHGGYGDRYLTGNGFKTMVRQGVKTGLVCSLELLAKSLQYASVMIVMCPCRNSEPWLISYSHLKSPASIRLMGL